MTDTQADLFRDTNMRRRDKGIERATSHAERVTDGWNARADGAMRSFLIERCGTAFIAEDFRRYALERFGLAQPPDGRAFGGVIQRAARAGKIVKTGRYLEDAYCSPKAEWQERRG